MKKKLKILTAAILTLLMAVAGCGRAGDGGGSANSGQPGEYIMIPALAEGTADSSNDAEEAEELTVYYLPQGCALLESAGQYVLIDGCSAAGAVPVLQYLSELGVPRLNYIIVPSVSEERFGGVKTIMDNIQTGLIVTPQSDTTTPDYETFTESVGEVNIIKVGTGSSFNVGTCAITPVAPIVEQGEDYLDTALILKVTCGDTAFLFPNDATEAEANTLLSDDADLKADVVFANNNGGNTTLPYAILRLVSPKYVIATTTCTAMPDVSEFSATDTVTIYNEPVILRTDGTDVLFAK